MVGRVLGNLGQPTDTYRRAIFFGVGALLHSPRIFLRAQLTPRISRREFNRIT